MRMLNGSFSDVGLEGNYNIEFFALNSTDACGYVDFYVDSSGKTCALDYEYNDSTGEWDEVLVETNTVYYKSYNEIGDIGTAEDEKALYLITIQNVPNTVTSVQTQYLDDSMCEMDSHITTTIVGDGTVQIDEMCSGYYTFNFYDVSNNCIGYTMFYMDENGATYSYIISESAEEPILTEMGTIEYIALEEELEYTYGNTSVSVYGVTEEIDSVEAYYFIGNENDETILFEPELSSVYTEPLIVNGLGMEGKYKLSFYISGEVVGNAEFYLDASGKLYEYDYEYNSSSGEWEEVLVETDSIYYFENTDIQDTDDYGYGNINMTITNVPNDVKYAEIYYFDADDTYTTGTPIFPDITISGKGTVAVSNLGAEGYYEADLLKSDGVTKIGYVFFYIDSNSEIYLIEYSINDDTYQIETTMTKMSSIPLSEYVSSTVEYITGTNSVSIYNVPTTVNRILVSCATSNGEYATYEDTITVDAAGVAVLENLGMEGDYTVTFLTDKNYIGSAAFYLEADGSVSEAEYSYSTENGISITLVELDKVIFVSSTEIISYEAGDIDFSGSIAMIDAVTLQKYLLNVQKLSASQYNVADLTQDGRVNTFDLIMLKRLMLE